MINTTIRTNAIIETLNNRKIRRVPLDDETIKTIEKNIATSGNNQVQMIGYWGVGEKKIPNKPDYDALERLREIMTSTGNKIKVCLLLADKHGQLNGYKNSAYLEKISKLAGERNIDTMWLSSLYEDLNIKVPDLTNINDDIWLKYPDCYRFFLEERAKKHQKICLAMEDAKRYLCMTQIEKEKFSQYFLNTIWFTYGDIKRLKDLYPKPIISIWPFKRGKSELPWFS